MKLKHIFIALTLLAVLPVSAQVTVEARIDSTAILIGEQTALRLAAIQPADRTVQFPLFSDTITGGLEIVEYGKADTLPADGGNIKVQQTYVVTAFMDSLYYVPGMPFVSDGDTFYTAPLALKVIQPFEIDTASHQLADIKGIYKAPIYWWGIFRIVLLIVLLAGLAVLGWWLYVRYGKRGKDEAEVQQPSELVRPPYEVAVEQLDRIKAEKIWQRTNRQKEYHTQVTDVLRVYISGVFGISCMEMTSQDILEALQKVLKTQKEVYAVLRQTLELADRVKFAKWYPTPDENEQSLRNAYQFVETVRPMPEPSTDTAITTSETIKE